MGVESATYIGDLTPSEPGSSDLINQGDDHLRLIKQVLQNSFPSLEKAIYFPNGAQKSADFSVVAADMNKTFFVTTTSGVVNMTLPSTLGVGDAGWECFLMKASFDTNPVMVKPATGTLTSGPLTGLAAARRCIPTTKISCFWTGSSFIISRATQAGPVGSAIEYHGSNLPYGFEWPNGQLLASAATLYPELNAVLGSGQTFDKRGRLAIPLDNLGGSAAGRVTTAGGGVDGSTEGAVGGNQAPALVLGNLPSIPLSVSGTVTVNVSGNVPTTTGVWNNRVVSSGGADPYPGPTTAVGNASSFSGAATLTGTGGGSSTPVKTLPPSIVVAQLLVTE